MKKIIALLISMFMLTGLLGCSAAEEENLYSEEPNIVETEEEQGAAETQEQVEEAVKEVEVNTEKEVIDEKNATEGYLTVKDIEDNDVCKVKITNTDIDMGEFSESLDYFLTPDGVHFTIQNNDEQMVTDITLFAVGYNKKDDKWCDLKDNITLTPDEDVRLEIYECTAEVELEAGKTDETVLPCDAERYSEVRAIVSAYTTADGVTHENPGADEWVDAVYLASGKVEFVETGYKSESYLALKELEEQDMFPVKAKVDEIIVDYYSSLTSVNGENDIANVLVENADTQMMTQFEIYAVGYYNGSWQQIQESFSIDPNEPNVQPFYADGLEHPAGEKVIYSLTCNVDRSKEVCVIVSSYTTEDGTVHENPLAKDWLDIVLAEN